MVVGGVREDAKANAATQNAVRVPEYIPAAATSMMLAMHLLSLAPGVNDLFVLLRGPP